MESEEAWTDYTFAIIAGLLVLSIPCGLVGLLFRRMSLFRAAATTDEQLQLRERLSSAILLRGDLKPMEELLQEDAIQAAAKIQPRRDFPFDPQCPGTQQIGL